MKRNNIYCFNLLPSQAHLNILILMVNETSCVYCTVYTVQCIWVKIRVYYCNSLNLNLHTIHFLYKSFFRTHYTFSRHILRFLDALYNVRPSLWVWWYNCRPGKRSGGETPPCSSQGGTKLPKWFKTGK